MVPPVGWLEGTAGSSGRIRRFALWRLRNTSPTCGRPPSVTFGSLKAKHSVTSLLWAVGDVAMVRRIARPRLGRTSCTKPRRMTLFRWSSRPWTWVLATAAARATRAEPLPQATAILDAAVDSEIVLLPHVKVPRNVHHLRKAKRSCQWCSSTREVGMSRWCAASRLGLVAQDETVAGFSHSKWATGVRWFEG